MNRKLISSALANVDDLFITETMYPPEANSDRARERTNQMNNSGANRKSVLTRRVLRLALAACLIFALALTTYAFHFLGIREMLEKDGEKLPEQAYEYIQTHDMSIDSKVWRCDVTESLTDEKNIFITVTVTTPGEYVLVPTYASAEDPVSLIGLEGSQTLAEYAKAQKKKLLFVGMDIEEREALGIAHTAQSFESVSPQELTILWEAQKTVSTPIKEVICVVTGKEETAVRSHHMGITLVEAPGESAGQYVPDNANPFPGMTVGNLNVSESPLGISIRFMTSVESQEVFDDIKKVEFDGIVRGEGGGWVLEDDGNWWHTISRCTGEVGDTLVARYYDWDDQVIATVTFNRK